MKVARASILRRLEMQGFSCEAAGGSTASLRFTPAVSAVVLIVATALRSPHLFWAFAAVALIGAAGGHAFDLVFNHLVRHLVHAERLPPTPRPRRFAMFLAAALSLCAGVLLARGEVLAGLIVGALLVAAALLVASTHFCLGSWIYRRLGLGA